MPRLTGGEAVVEQLERAGVDVVFGMPGVHTLDIYDALIDSDIDHVTTRHEQGAGFMADGYARTTGRVGVALVITGPGLTNAATPIGQAYSDSSPLLVISSQLELTEDGRGRGYLHELKDQQGVMENMTAYSERVERVADVPGAIADALDYLDSRRPRPVHLQIPIDVLARADAVDLADVGASTPSPDADRLDEAADLLADADAPLLVAGGGAAGAAEQVRELVETTGMPALATVAGKGVLPDDHPLALGARGGDDDVEEFVASRDAALVVGSELSPRDVPLDALPDDVVYVDVDYANFGRNADPTVGVVADAATALDDLLDRLDGVDAGADVADAVAAATPAPASDAAGDPDGDGRHRIAAALRDALDDDAVLVNDMTKLCYEAQSAYPAREPDTFLFPQGYGTLGFSPPTAYGAAVGNPDRQVVALVGDGGFLFTVQDLATAVKYDLSLPVVVLNDDCYGVVDDVQQRDYGRSLGTDIDNPSFVDLARSFGAAAERVEMADVEADLPAALADAFERDRPTLVEVPVDF
jgi:acetolactate synthase-1/2/3 large subunit